MGELVSESDFPGGRSLFDAMPQLGWVARADGFITYYNRRWYDYTGTTPAAMEGWGWQSVHDPALLPSVLERWRAAIATGEPFEMSFPLRRHDGVFRWFKTHAIPMRDVHGSITRWIGINTDIDDQKRAEALVTAQWRRVEAMLREAPAAIAVVAGPEHVYELANPLYCKLVGRSSEQLLGKAGRVALPELVEQGVWDIYDRVWVSGDRFVARSFPARLDRNGDGILDEGFFDFVAQPVHGPDGAIERILMFATETTEQVRERERIEALARDEAEARRRAEEARARLERLTEVALALAGAMTLRDVAEVVVEQGMRSAGADACTLYVLDGSGETLQLLGHRGCAPEVVAAIQRISATEGNPAVFAAARARVSRWAETEKEYAEMFPAVATMNATGPRAKAFWSMPLVAEARSIGLLGMGYYRERHFSAEERVFVETFATQCAQALLRAERRERETEARRWLATTLQSIGDAVIATDTQGRVSFMNAVAEGLTGWTEPEARGRPLEDVFAIFSEITGEPVESPVAKVLREGTVVGLANHTILRAKGGTEIAIDDSGAPIRDENGNLFGVVLVFRDVSAEKLAHKRRDFLAQAGEAVASSLDYRATLATVAQLAVPELADWCTVEMLEPGADAPQQLAVAHADPSMLAYAREIGERYPPDPHARTGAPEVIRTGKSEIYPEIPAELLEAGAKDAEHLRILRALRLESAIVVPLKAPDGPVFGAMTFIYAASGRRYTNDDLAFAEDFARRAAMAIANANAMTELSAARERESAARREAELASGAKDQFLATVSHELRTPLNAILGWTVMLRRGNQPPEIERTLGVIERNARAQARIIEDVLDVSRIVTGKLALNLAPVDVVASVHMAVDGIRPTAEAKGVSLTIGALPNAGATILADGDRLEQILWNLLSNAVKFTPRGGAVSVRVDVLGSEVSFAVSDTGEGIRRDVLPRVFDHFQQADSSTTRRHGGLGLGLALVKQLVHAHGGSVTASSDGDGKGSTFVVRMPLRAEVPATEASAPTSSVPPGSLAAALPRLDRLTVVVVDDDEDARELIGEVLRGCGATVHLAASAGVALAIVPRVRPDVIVSDIGMPEVDGYALMRTLRSMPANDGGQTPAIAVTAYSRDEDRRSALASGYERHIAKPVDIPALVGLVRSLAGGKPA